MNTPHAFTALIADDEPLARQRMRRLLQSVSLACPLHVLPQEACNGKEVLQFVNRLQPDILFLDIHMPGSDGTLLAKQLQHCNKPPAIIYCTAYDHHAIDAFRVGAIDYLLKPIQESQLQEAINRVLNITSFAQPETDKTSVTLPIQMSKGTEYLNSNTILCLHAEEKYTRIYHYNGSTLTNSSLKSLEQKLPDTFIRIHRKTIISLSAIRALEKNTRYTWYVKLYGINDIFPVSRRRLNQLKKRIQPK